MNFAIQRKELDTVGRFKTINQLASGLNTLYSTQTRSKSVRFQQCPPELNNSIHIWHLPMICIFFHSSSALTSYGSAALFLARAQNCRASLFSAQQDGTDTATGEIAGKLTCNLETLPSVCGGRWREMPESIVTISTLSFGVFAIFLQGKVCALSEWSVIGGLPHGQFTASKGNQQLWFKDPSYEKKLHILFINQKRLALYSQNQCYTVTIRPFRHNLQTYFI